VRRLFLILSMTALSCVQVVATVTPSAPAPSTPAPAATAAPQATATHSPTEAAEADTAIVIQPVVNIHETPGGIVRTDVWLIAGQRVEVLEIRCDWARIAEGWVFAGCLEGISDRECRADE
jgi:hypothetical protein